MLCHGVLSHIHLQRNTIHVFVQIPKYASDEADDTRAIMIRAVSFKRKYRTKKGTTVKRHMPENKQKRL